MVGAFKIDEVIPLLARYVGGSAVTGNGDVAFKDVGLHFPSTDRARDRSRRGANPGARP